MQVQQSLSGYCKQTRGCKYFVEVILESPILMKNATCLDISIPTRHCYGTLNIIYVAYNYSVFKGFLVNLLQ